MEARSVSRRLLGLAVGCLAIVAVSAPAASAATIAPTSANFGNQNVGTSSAPKTFTVTNGCAIPFMGSCLFPEFTFLSPAISPATHYSQTNTCGVGLFSFPASCTINATFKPTTAGTKNATLNAGSSLTASLTGEGVNPPGQAGQGGQGGQGGAGAKKGKCKKGFKKKRIKKKGKTVVKCVKKKKKRR